MIILGDTRACVYLKDTRALDAFVKELGLDLKLFETMESENDKFKKTVFDGMRL